MTNDQNNNARPMTGDSRIVLYQPDETLTLEVRLERETVWLTQAQMTELFHTTRNNVTIHIGNIFKVNWMNHQCVRIPYVLRPMGRSIELSTITLM